MRVLVVIDSLGVGGAEMSLATLSPGLVAKGIELDVAYLRDRVDLGPEIERAGATLHAIEVGESRIGATRGVLRLVRGLQPDLVHTTLFEADLSGRMGGWLGRAPVVSSLVSEAYGPDHIHNPDYWAWKVRLGQAVDMATARLVSRFHAVSASAASVMSKRLRIDPSLIEVIPRGRDPKALGQLTDERRAAARAELGVDDEPIVLTIGRHAHVKRFERVVAAMPRLRSEVPGAKLFMAGREGPATGRIRALIDELGLDDAVEILGHRTDVPDLLCAADALVLASSSEGSPGALLEAMAMRVPVVAADIGAVREVAGASNGIVRLADVEDAGDLAGAIGGVLTGGQSTDDMVEAAHRRFSTTYSIDVVVDRMAEFYRRAVDSAR